MEGILLVDKLKNWTSFDVVAKVRSVLKQAGEIKLKVGHTGTLDPLASGLLVLLIGNYTKHAGDFSKLDKTYEAVLKLGATSSTGDDEGEKALVSQKRPTKEEIKKVLKRSTGKLWQTPPAYSAIKVNGQRAYKLARQGKAVELKPREIEIYSLEITDYSYPLLKITVHVSSGTYIRSLAQDIGEKLGTGAYIKELKRTQVGKYLLNDALSLQKISAEAISGHIQKLNE